MCLVYTVSSSFLLIQVEMNIDYSLLELVLIYCIRVMCRFKVAATL